MALSFKDTAALLVEGNKTAFKANASRRAGSMFNERVANLVTPRLPAMVRMSGITTEPWFKFVLANAVAGAIVKFGGTNPKLAMLADAGVNAANDDFLGSFNLEAMINELVDGIDVSGLTNATDTVRETTSSGLRKASEFVGPKVQEA